MSYRVTVVNKTATQVAVGIDRAYPTSAPNSIHGGLANGVLNPGATSGFLISGTTGPYQVGYLTVLSGNNPFLSNSYHSRIIVYDIYPNNAVTVSTAVAIAADQG